MEPRNAPQRRCAPWAGAAALLAALLLLAPATSVPIVLEGGTYDATLLTCTLSNSSCVSLLRASATWGQSGVYVAGVALQAGFQLGKPNIYMGRATAPFWPVSMGRGAAILASYLDTVQYYDDYDPDTLIASATLDDLARPYVFGLVTNPPCARGPRGAAAPVDSPAPVNSSPPVGSSPSPPPDGVPDDASPPVCSNRTASVAAVGAAPNSKLCAIRRVSAELVILCVCVCVFRV